MRLSFRIFLFQILLFETARTGVSEAFSIDRYTTARVRLYQDGTLTTSTWLALYPQKADDSDFRSPAASFTFTRCATATLTADFAQSGWNDGQGSRPLSYLDIISSLVKVPENLGQNQEVINDEPLAQAHRIQQAYREWCDFYGKTSSKERLGVFSSNFLAVEEFHERTGRPLVLNQFADLTEEEYLRGQQQSAIDVAASASAPAPASAQQEEVVEERIRVAYKEWCEYYGRVWDAERLPTFASNFIAVEKYHQHTKQPLVLNEFADMTEREYEEYLATVAQSTAPENTGTESTGVATSFSSREEPIAFTPAPASDAQTTDFSRVASFSSPIEPIASASASASASSSAPAPDPQPTAVPQAGETRPPAPSSPTQVVRSEDEIIGVPDAPSSTDEVLSALQETIASLTTMVHDMASATQVVAPRTQAQPLDSLVIDVLQQQDDSISQLEMSIDGLHQIQMQSSDLIELVSNNQKQMTEMMAAVQSEIAALQHEQTITNENYAILLARIDELEEAVRRHDINDPSLNKALVLARSTATRGKMLVEVKPNIPAIAANPMFKPINLDPPRYPPQ